MTGEGTVPPKESYKRRPYGAGKLTAYFMNGQNREKVKIGSKVEVVLKADQRTGKLTRGTVAEILTNSSFHPRGIKVRLKDGQIGRVQNIIPPSTQTAP